MLASTTPSITFRASDTPTEIATPVWPNAAAMVAAPANELMSDTSLAAMSISPTMMRLGRAPAVVDAVSMPDCTRTPIWFSAQTPEPLTATPVWPAAMAADPATTSASII